MWSYPLCIVAGALVNQDIMASSVKISWIFGFKPCLFMISNTYSSNFSDGMPLDFAGLSTKSCFNPVNFKPFAHKPPLRSTTV